MIRNNKRKDAKTEKFSVFIRYPVNTAGSTFPFVFWNISEFDNSVIFWNFQEKSVIFPQKPGSLTKYYMKECIHIIPLYCQPYFIAEFKHKSQTKHTTDTKLKALVR